MRKITTAACVGITFSPLNWRVAFEDFHNCWFVYVGPFRFTAQI